MALILAKTIRLKDGTEVLLRCADDRDALALLDATRAIFADGDGMVIDPDEFEKTEDQEKAWTARLNRARAVRSKIEELALDGVGQDIPGVRGTLWAAVQGVSEFADQWDAPRSKDRANRFLFGQSGALLDRAFATALDLIKT